MDGQPLIPTQLEVGDTSDSARVTLTLHSLARSMDDIFAQILEMMRAQAATMPAHTITLTAPISQAAVAPTTPHTPIQAAIFGTPTERVGLVVVPTETPTTTLLRAKQSVVKLTSGSTMSVEAKRVKDFIRFQPGYFYGVGDPKIVGKWLLLHERLHKLLFFEERDRPPLQEYDGLATTNSNILNLLLNNNKSTTYMHQISRFVDHETTIQRQICDKSFVTDC
ncbi:hypothetical protein Scep_015190 [Stephania cephalantha]|uniref:Uncharacterized protein n=1 Tax=Stephania cephalantha TaxID=152367 RepID=A0AAP0J2Q5_9MAGN